MAATDRWFELGERLRRTALQNGSAGAGPPSWSAGGQGAAGTADYLGGAPGGAKAQGMTGLFNQAARLRSGNLLFVYLGNNAIFQADPDEGWVEYVATLGHEQQPFLWRVIADRRRQLYCSLSGLRDTRTPRAEAAFGLAGAVARADVRLADLEVVAFGDRLVDPCGMHFLDETRLLVSDFAGFGSPGAIYTIDVLSGEVEMLAEGGLLREPVSAYRDPDGVTWVANSYMNYFYGHRGGVVEKDDGELLRIDPDGHQEIVMRRRSPAAGSVVGVHPSNSDDHVIVVKGDWPVMEASGVLRVEKATGEVEVLLEASREAPRFYSTHVGVRGNVLWVGESYEKELIGYDLDAGEVVQRIDVSGILGHWRGVASSFEGIESVSVIPELDPD